jgi:hypothetical protein
LVFVVVAIKAEQFPVAAIGGIVVVIMVAMMHGKLGQVSAGEFPLTTAANPRVKFERLFTIGFCALILMATGIADNFVQRIIV